MTERPQTVREGSRIAAGVSWTIASRLLSSGAALAAQVLLARWLGPEGNGLMAAALADLAIAMLLADLGLNGSIARLLARAYYKDPSRIPRIVRSAAILKAGLTLTVGAGLFLGAPAVSRYVHRDAALAPVIAMAAVQLVCDTAATFGFRGLQGLHRPKPHALAQMVSGVGSPLFAVGLAGLALGGGLSQLEGLRYGPAALGASAAVLGRAAGAGLAGVFAAWALAVAVRRVARSEPAGTPEALGGSPISEIVRFARRLLWVNVAYLLVFRLDLGLVQALLGTEAAGFYALPALLAERLMMPAHSLALVIAPYFAALGDPAREGFLGRLYGRVLRVMAVLYIPMGVGLYLVASDAVVVVFGAEYRPSVPLVRLYAVVLPVVALAHLLGPILDYGGFAGRRAISFLLAAAVDVGLNLLLLPRVGAAGAIVALGVSFSPLVAYYIVHLAREVGVARDVKRLLSPLGSAAVMALVVLAVGPAEPGAESAGRLAALVLAGAASYLAVLFATGGVRRTDLAALRRPS